ncbi:MAG: N-acyl-D-glutamate deacylase [bacterium ADurb.Bin236]|nr:MAG: N-acyl-D-glutamate deacylase [bacterium ADurb.Bin236]HPN95085.1 D-aminoacylase [bacterium]
MPDIIIKNGTVVDGTGAPGFVADVAITGDKIEAIGKFEKVNGCKTIDATGKIVCPGIVDPHSHADMTIFREDHRDILAPLVKQGITTFIGGNCGMSMAPYGGENQNLIRDYLAAFTGMDIEAAVKWNSTGEFISHIEKNGMLLNMGLLAPHGLLRIDAMGMDTRSATDDEVGKMSRTLEKSLEEGAIGLSTGLQYMPGLQSDTRELVALGKVLSKYDGIFTSHLRSYMNTLPEAVDEVVEVARTNDIRAQISHIFWVPDMGWFGGVFRMFAGALIKMSKYWSLPIPLDGEEGKQFKKLDKLREQGVKISVDAMPTTTGFTHLFAFFPPWALTGGKEEIIKRCKDPETRKEMLYDITHGKLIWPHTGKNTWSLNLFKIMGWGCARIMAVVSEKNKRYEGMQLLTIAREQGKHPFDAACDLLVEEDGCVLVFESMGEPEDRFTERSLFAALKDPNVSISTDTILMGFGKPSYLFHGCYPKFISRYVRDMKLLPLELGVRKMTGLAAEHFQLKDRGLLKEKWFADVLVMDLNTIAPNCSFVNPTGNPSGVEHVFINGCHTVKDGELLPDAMPGRTLKR